jgi:hypothetical protein
MVDKVYASCVQNITATETVPEMELPPGCIPPGTTSGALACTLNLSDSTCSVGAVVPTGVDCINNITYTIAAVVDVTCVNGVTTFPVTIYTTTTVPLYNPSGTTPACTIISGTCSAVILPNGQLSVQVTLCLLLQTLATVQLLVPSYGYCVPTPCEVAAIGVCPPSNLFPPQS